MSRINIFFGLVVIFFSGCTPQKGGLEFRNEYAVDADITIVYKDGKKETVIWPSCSMHYLGSQDKVVESVAVTSKGSDPQSFGQEEITRFTEYETREGKSIWVLSKSGIWPTKEKKCALSAEKS